MKLLLGSTNEGKFVEIGEALSGLPVSLARPGEFGIKDSPDEIGDSYSMNAMIKASYYHALSGQPTIADDSGIVVEALQGELGVQTRRWGAGPEATDEEWITFFLKRMQQEENRRARFICDLAFIDSAGNTHLFEGTCDGVITDTLEAGYLPGLPISACFRPEGYPVVYSAMTTEQKNAVSHRGKAMGEFRSYLQQKLNPSS